MTQESNNPDRAADNSIVDPLLDCLSIIIQMHHQPHSREALKAGLPLVNHRLTPVTFVRAAERVGFSARILTKPLQKMSKLILPAVLLLKNEQACILQKVNDDDTVDVIMPDSGGVTKIALSELAENYLGYAIFIKPAFQFDTNTPPPLDQSIRQSWFWGTIWRYHSIYMQVILASLFINLFTLASTLFVMAVYDRVIPNYALTTLWVLFSGIVVIFVFDFILRTLRSYLIDVCGKKADILIASKIFQQVIGIQLAYKPPSVGAFVNNIREFETLRDFITSSTLTTFVDIPFIFLYIALIAYLGGSLIFIPLLVIALVFGVTYFLEKPIRGKIAKSLQANTQKNAILVESITGLETIKCLSVEGVMQRRWEEATSQAAKHGLSARFLSGLVVNISNLSQQLIYILTVTYGVYLIQEEKLTIGGLIACNILVGRMVAPIAQFIGILTRFEQSRLALNNLQKIMDTPQERSLQEKFLHRPTLSGQFEFEDVCFQYPGQSTLALDRISFKIKKGEHLAILGPMGSGKSTIHKLILGLYHPQSGRILVDGIDIRQIDPVDLRRAIGYVPQDNVLFYGTIRDNISLSVPWANDIAISMVAKMTGVSKFVNLHPNGLDMLIGERGEGISGGQRQSVAIARALLSNPSIWLFDEPTSAMDNQNEAELIANLYAYLKTKTLLLVTHRLTLLPLVERIIILDKGQVKLDDTKENVLAALQKKAADANNQSNQSDKPPSS